MNYSKVLSIMLTVLVLAGVVTGGFTEEQVQDLQGFELTSRKDGNFLVTAGGLSAGGQALRAGGQCKDGEYVRFLACEGETSTDCTDLFDTLWLKSNTNDLLLYRDEMQNENDFWATYECYQLKEEAQTPSAPASESQSCSIAGKEGDLIKFTVDIADPDGDQLTTTFDFGKLNSEIKKKGNTFEWQTAKGDAGTYAFSAETTDGEFSETLTDCIALSSTNTPPQVLNAKDLTIAEGETAQSQATCSDPEGEVAPVFSGWLTSSSKQTTYSDAGVYTATITCTDADGASDSATIQITVRNKNRAPSIKLAQN